MTVEAGWEPPWCRRLLVMDMWRAAVARNGCGALPVMHSTVQRFASVHQPALLSRWVKAGFMASV